MILNLYFQKILTPILVISFVLVGIFTFDYAELFARWFLVGVIVFALVKLKARDVNMVGLIGIIIFERTVETIAHLIYSNFDAKVAIYLSAAAIMYGLRYDKLVKLLCIPIVILSILSELYWSYTDYEAPLIHAYVLMILLNLITRHLLFMRVPFTDKLIDGGKSLPLDWKFYDLAKWSVWVIAIMIAEYLVRHLTPLNSLFVYNAYTPLMHAIAVTSLYYLTDDYLRSRFILTA